MGQRIATLAESTLTGRGLMDIAAGRLIETSLAGDVVVSGIVYAADMNGNMQPQADITGQGRMSLESKAKLVGQADPIAVTPPSSAGATDFTGEYTNADMTLTLTHSGEGYEGTLKLGDQAFPIRGNVSGATLRGAFESNGTWFDYTATCSGTTLSLTSGGKTHVLQKKATPRNPLGGDGPANPLGKGGSPANPKSGAAATSNPTPRPSSTLTSAAGTAKPAVASYSVFRCLDHQGFRDRAGQPLEVFRMLIPQGWRFDGGVTWKVNLTSPTEMSRVDLVNPAILTFGVHSPHDRVVVQAYPEVHFADLRGSPAAAMGAFPEGSDYGRFCRLPDDGPHHVHHRLRDPAAARPTRKRPHC